MARPSVTAVARVAGVAGVAGLGAVLAALLLPWQPPAAPPAAALAIHAAPAASRASGEPARQAPAAPSPGPRPPASPPAPAPPDGAARADTALRREGRDFIGGGFLAVPQAFRSADGGYDIIIHFHGNTDLVEESYRVSGLSAVVLILNHDGTGSGVYESRYYHPAVLSHLLERVRAALEARGLRGARQRRLALSAWSAGYGAVLRSLAQPEHVETIDAVLLLDGLHCGYTTDHTPDVARLDPFTRFARRALAGDRLFSITHSEIQPAGAYAGTRQATDAILSLLGVLRTPLAEAPPLPALASMRGVLRAELLRPLDPLTQARSGGLVVRGYAGAREEHHAMHLVQMSVTALPDLVRFWSTPQPR